MTGKDRYHEARQRWDATLRYLMEQEATEADPARKLQLSNQIKECRDKIAEIDAGDKRQTVITGPRIDLARLPAGAADFLGREAELALLDEALADHQRTELVELVAPGGVGKTALVKRWLDRLRADGWRGLERIFGWSFGSQGSAEDRQASDDSFLSAALGWLGVEHDPALGPGDKGRLLANAVAARHTLLVLDGVEPLQYPPGPMAGELRAPGLKALLGQLASSGQPGLTLVTTRQRIADLAEYERGDGHSQGTVVPHDLGNLHRTDGAGLLHRLGCRRAGVAAIGPEDAELAAASDEVQGHALTLTLLGSYLAQAHQGDIRRRDTVRLQDADETRGGRAFQVMGAYETWLAREGDRGARELAALRLFGLFDRPADAGCLAALRQAPPIPGLTEPLVDLTAAQWNVTLSRLAGCGLIERGASEGMGPEETVIHTHHLVREYLAAQLRERQPDAWREGHRRLYEYLKARAPYRPDGLGGLQPLYQAVAHGCLAGYHRASFEEVLWPRIFREELQYSFRRLAAAGADLQALSWFFSEPWHRMRATLDHDQQRKLAGFASRRLLALGRLGEAHESGLLAAQSCHDAEESPGAPTHLVHLCEVELLLGDLGRAEATGRRALRSLACASNQRWRAVAAAMCADVFHQEGERHAASEHFKQAEMAQADAEPSRPRLYTLRGFQLCDFLLSQVERQAWSRQLAPNDAEPSPSSLDAIDAVTRRAEEGLEWQDRLPSEEVPIMDAALHWLTLARAGLYRAVLGAPEPRQLHSEIGKATDGLRQAFTIHHLPRALMTKAWVQLRAGDSAGARADLDEAWQIASRGGMRLFMADIHLHRARLFRDKAALRRARALIEQCGYWRRKEELEDAEHAAADQGWPEAGAVDTGRPGAAGRPAQDSPPSLAGALLMTSTQIPNDQRTLVYISYSHKDLEWHRRLRRVLDADPAIRDLVWDDTKIPPDTDWRWEIRDHVARARIMIMLGSPDYFAPGCGAEELEIAPAIAAHGKGELAILWFRARQHDITGTPVAGIMAATGPGAVPLDSLPPDAQEAALDHIRRQVLRLLGREPDTMTTTAKRFGIALSFPGERRAFVEQVAELLGQRLGRDRVLYDRWYEAELARPDLDTYLQALYHDQSELIAVFLSAEYEQKDWCGLEWRALRDLIKRRRTAGIMPLRFDATEIPGLFSTDGYAWIGDGRSPESVADLILQRWQIETGRGATSPPPTGPAPAQAPPASTAGPPKVSPALAIWQEKLDFFLQQEAAEADPARQFQLRRQIDECRAKIRELGGTA